MKTFIQASVTGAFGGWIIIVIASAFDTGVIWSELWALPLIVVGYSLFALPFVAAGLAIFGMPLRSFVTPVAHKLWMGIFAIFYGAVAGKLAFFAIDQSLFMGFYDLTSIGWKDFGLIFGIVTGLAWWLFTKQNIALVGNQSAESKRAPEAP